MKFWTTRVLSILAVVAFATILTQVGAAGDAARNVLFNSRLIAMAGIFVTLAVSLNLVNGITGQFSIGHAGFFQVGAYTAAVLSQQFFKPGTNVMVWLLVVTGAAIVTSAIAGFIVGLPSLRLRGDYLAIVTMGFGEIIRIFTTTQPWLGGAYGINVTPDFKPVFYSWLLAALAIALSRNLLKTAHGLPFLAVREDEVASNAMGVNTTKIKVIAFVLSAVLAGMTGALYAHNESFVTPMNFRMDVSFLILTMVVLGGTGSITGSAITALVLFYLPEFLRGSNMIQAPVLVGLILAVFVAVAFARQGLDRHFATASQKQQFVLTRGAISLAVGALVAFGLGAIPKVAGMAFEYNRVRMLIFAVVLVVMMMLRPQGVFGHHEFSWDLLKRRAKAA